MDTNNIYLVHKQRYKDALKQVLLRLHNRKREVALGIWLTIVIDQKEEIILHPNLYMGKELSLPQETIKIVEGIFHDFLKHELLDR